MNEDIKQLIKEKQVIQRQKNYSEVILKNQNTKISDYLCSCDMLINPELQSLLSEVKVYSKLLSRNTSPLFVRNDIENWYKEYSWESDVISVLKNYLNSLDEDSLYLWFIEENSPVFYISRATILTLINELCMRDSNGWKIIDGLCIFSMNLESGFAVQKYAGYLESDPNPNEILYGVDRWGRNLNSSVNSIT